MNIINAKLQNCLKLSSKITVYVPATNGVDKATDNTAQVEKTASLLAGLFGGSTSTAALGYWLSPVAGLVAEATTVVFAYAAEKDLQEHIGEVVELCEELKKENEQLRSAVSQKDTDLRKKNAALAEKDAEIAYLQQQQHQFRNQK